MVPGVLAQTVESDQVEVESSPDDAPTVKLADLSGGRGTSAAGVDFTIDYATGEASDDDIVSLSTGRDAVTAHVQPTAFGVRVLTSIEDDSAPEQYDYTFEVPAGTRMLESSGGMSYLVDDEDVYGAILDPWAVDAAGQPVPTYYTWSGQTLTQHLDLSSDDIVFPVVADPAWTYSYKFPISKSAAQVKSLLTSCFNCYFTVAGAPARYPAANQLLPLEVGVLNFECRFAGNLYTSTMVWKGFKFNATANHVDGAGSYINFVFEPVGGRMHLLVSALIVNDSFWLNNAFYRSGAIQKWQGFANNIG